MSDNESNPLIEVMEPTGDDGQPPAAVDGELVTSDLDTGRNAAATSQPTARPAAKRPAKKRATKRKATKKKAPPKTQSGRADDAAAGRARVRPFPASSFEDAAELANTMHHMGSDHVRRLTLFEQLDRSADSGTSRQQIINSGRYGITTGGIRAEFLTLTEDGNVATSPEVARRQQLRARFRLAMESIEPFKHLYEEFAGKRLPSQAVMRDFLRDKGFADNGSFASKRGVMG